MRVAVDGRSQRAGRAPRGIAVYLDLLLPELAAGGDELEVIRERGRLAYASAALLRRPRLDRIAGGCDVVWAPAPAPLAVSRGVPLVMTVHDLSFEHRPRDYTPYERLWHVLARPRALARRAARLIAVSHAVRDQLLDEWGLPEEKVVAIPSGPGRPRTPPQTPGEPLPASYFLAVGAIEPRKRVDLLLEAHAAARREGLQASLVLAGDGRLAERARAAGAEVLGFVPDAQLEAAYAGALALVSASREEGFGFPPLEALARAVPAVVPDLPPFRETLGDAALRYPEADVDALAAAMLRLEREAGLRARLAAAADAAVGRFSWKEAARRTGEVLREAAA